MFSIVDALLLHPLPFRNPSELTVIQERDGQGAVYSVSAADYIDWRKQAKSFSELAGWWPAAFVVTGGDRPVQISGATITANFFHTLEVKPALGRIFLPDEDGIDDPAAASKVALISYRLWQDTLLRGDPNVLGRTIKLNSTAYAVVGVMPPDFKLFWRNYQVWVPVTLDRQNRDYHGLRVIGRLKGTRAAAQAEMSAVASPARLPNNIPKSNKSWTIQITGPAGMDGERNAALPPAAAVRRGGIDSLNYLRQRRKPSAGAIGGAQAGDRRAPVAGRDARPSGAAASYRKCSVVRHRRRCGARSGVAADPPDSDAGAGRGPARSRVGSN